MDVLKLQVPHRLTLLGFGAMLALLALLLTWAVPAGNVHAQDAGGAMSIAIDGSGVDCDGDECIVDPGTDFTLTISVDEAPDAGYIGIATQIDYQNLTYTRTEMATVEVLISVDGFPGIVVRTPEDDTSLVGHGMTAGTPPFTTSHFTGPIVELAMTCTDEYTRNEVALAPFADPGNTLGTGFKLPAEAGGTNVPASDGLLVHCGPPPTPTPGPSATPTPGPALPTTGTGDTGSSDTAMVLTIAALLAAAAFTSVGELAWRQARR
jgi:hypothetical protein